MSKMNWDDMRVEAHEAAAMIKQVRAQKMADGTKGVCEWCDKHSPRIVGGACAPCRDKYRLK